jgi:hypothetical protein
MNPMAPEGRVVERDLRMAAERLLTRQDRGVRYADDSRECTAAWGNTCDLAVHGGGAVEELLSRDPVKDAEQAFAKGDRRQLWFLPATVRAARCFLVGHLMSRQKRWTLLKAATTAYVCRYGAEPSTPCVHEGRKVRGTL